MNGFGDRRRRLRRPHFGRAAIALSDAVRALESQGLIESHRSTLGQYRAVGTEEVTRTLHRKDTDRIGTLKTHLEALERYSDGSADDGLREA